MTSPIIVPSPAPNRRPKRGVGLTLWNGGNLKKVLTARVRSLISECMPDILTIHAGPDRLAGAVSSVAKDLRIVAPRSRLHIGLGWDYWIGLYIGGGCSASKAVAKLADTADLATSVGAEAIVHDAEAACKLNSAKTAEIGRAVIAQIRDEHPGLIQGHTAYDHPTLHHDDADGVYDDSKVIDEYAWRIFCDLLGVDWELPQNYVAPDGGVEFASRDALRRRFASSAASFARAIQLGWVRPSIPIDTYVQGHHVPFSQTATMGCEREIVQVWTGPFLDEGGRLDDSGAYALRILCALERTGYRRPGGLLQLMKDDSLPIDQPFPIAGRQVGRSLGIIVPTGVR